MKETRPEESCARAKQDQSWIPKVIKKRECTTFVEETQGNEAMCQCGAAKEDHPSAATGDHFSSAMMSQWESARHSTEYPTDAFGKLEFDGLRKRQNHFLRLSCDTPPKQMYTLMTKHWGLSTPNLVVSVVGGQAHYKLKPWIREVLRQGLVNAAQRTGAWLFTSGLRESVGRCVGEAVREFGTAASSHSHLKVIAIGITSWGLVRNRQQLVNPQGNFPAKYVQNPTQDCCCLDNNHEAFLLVDDGSVGRSGGEAAFRASLENYISHQKIGIKGSGVMEIPVLCMLIAGDASLLEQVALSLKSSMPWLVLEGSGGTADLICDILNETLKMKPSHEDGRDTPSHEVSEHIAEKVKRHFPAAERQLEKLTEKALSIYHNRHLITIFHGEQDGPDSLDIMLLKSLVKASKRRETNDSNPYMDELNLAVTWNRTDIARNELFNGSIQWTYDELEDYMTDALVNNKPEFVRLFNETSVNITEYMTCGRLESLYDSVEDGTLLHTLLQRRLCERQNTGGSLSSLENQSVFATGGDVDLLSRSVRNISLYEVSRLLRDILGDICLPFYYSALKLNKGISTRKAHKMVNNNLQGSYQYRNDPCPFPWVSLFIWAVLQNRSEMASYFWERAEEPVLTALGGCKILRELAKMESETQSKLSMYELAQKLERLAQDVFSKFYNNSESRSFALLIRKSTIWGEATCLQMASVADARLFFSHDGVQSLLSQIWWGEMNRKTPIWKLVLAFFLPPLIYTSLISFRKDPNEEKNVKEVSRKEPYSPNSETVFSFSDFKPTEEETEEYYNTVSKHKGSLPKTHMRPFVVHRWRQFWFAPVTSFVGNLLMYFLFLLLFAYVLLVDFKPPPPIGPSNAELVLYFWVFTLVCEEIRQTFFIGNAIISQKVKSYVHDVWNKCDIIALSLFIIALTSRMFEKTLEFARAMMALDFLVFTLRLIHIFAISKQLGPKIIIVGKMIKDVFFFFFFLAVWLFAYGVANQALLYSYDTRPEWILRRAFYRPYLHIFGQIPLEEIDATKFGDAHCTRNLTLIEAGAEPCIDTYANWLVIILLVVYLLVTNILLINLLIAMFSHTFYKVQDKSDIYWKFQRYSLIVEYHTRPSLAPPFIILSHLHLFIKRKIRHVPSVKVLHFAFELKEGKAHRLRTWEDIQKEAFLSAQSKKQRDTDTWSLKQTSSKVDAVLKQMNEILDHDHRLKRLELQVEYCSKALAWIIEALSQSNITSAHPPPTYRD